MREFGAGIVKFIEQMLTPSSNPVPISPKGDGYPHGDICELGVEVCCNVGGPTWTIDSGAPGYQTCFRDCVNCECFLEFVILE